jgi:hypothetical protein
MEPLESHFFKHNLHLNIFVFLILEILETQAMEDEETYWLKGDNTPSKVNNIYCFGSGHCFVEQICHNMI